VKPIDLREQVLMYACMDYRMLILLSLPPSLPPSLPDLLLVLLQHICLGFGRPGDDALQPRDLLLQEVRA